jgi:hypothetical protein
MTRAYHLTADTLRDGRPIPAIGEPLVHEGAIEICCSGLHASERILDALAYAPTDSTWLHVVECDGVIDRENDKFVCRRRTIVASYPLRVESLHVLTGEYAALACWCAGLTGEVYQMAATATTAYRLGEIDADTLREYWSAARDAARDAARAAARAAAWDAVESRAIALLTEVAR